MPAKLLIQSSRLPVGDFGGEQAAGITLRLKQCVVERCADASIPAGFKHAQLKLAPRRPEARDALRQPGLQPYRATIVPTVR